MELEDINSQTQSQTDSPVLLTSSTLSTNAPNISLSESRSPSPNSAAINAAREVTRLLDISWRKVIRNSFFFQ